MLASFPVAFEFGDLRVSGVPVVGKEFGEPRDGMVRNAREHVFEPGEGIDTGSLAGGHEAPQHGRRPAAFVAAKEHPVAAANGDAANGSLGAIIVDLKMA